MRNEIQNPCSENTSSMAPAMNAVCSPSSGSRNDAMVTRRAASEKGNRAPRSGGAIRASCYLAVCVFIALITSAHMLSFRRALLGAPPRYLAQNVTAAQPAIRSGDLLLFGGTHLDAALIRAWTLADISHVGLAMVARRKHTTRLFVYNCDADDFSHCYLRDKCVDGGSGGVMLNDFVVKCATYRGAVFHCPLRKRLTSAQLVTWQRDVLPRFANSAFRFHTTAMLHAAYPNVAPLVSLGDDALLCTELVALTLRALGVIPHGVHVAGQVSPQRLVDRLHDVGVIDKRATRQLKGTM